MPPRFPTALAPERDAPSGASADGVRVDVLRVGLLGLNAWLVTLLAPTLFHGWGPWHAHVGSAAAAVALALGLGWLPRHPDRARWALLAGFPPLLGLSWALRPEALPDGPHGAVSLVLSALSLLGFLAAASHACARPRAAHPAEHFPLVGRAALSEALPARGLRWALVGIPTLGVFTAVLVVPTLGAAPDAWGEMDSEGAVLSVVVAAVAGAGALAGVVGPGLRAERRRRRRRRVTRSVALSLLAAGAAALAWAALTYGNRW